MLLRNNKKSGFLCIRRLQDLSIVLRSFGNGRLVLFVADDEPFTKVYRQQVLNSAVSFPWLTSRGLHCCNGEQAAVAEPV